jgi:hypothetical protein
VQFWLSRQLPKVGAVCGKAARTGSVRGAHSNMRPYRDPDFVRVDESVSNSYEKLLAIQETETERNSLETHSFGIHRSCLVRVLPQSTSESPHQKLVSHRLESPGWSPK